MWDEITYPFQNFSGATVEVWEWIGLTDFIQQFILRTHAGIKVHPCYFIYLFIYFLVHPCVSKMAACPNIQE